MVRSRRARRLSLRVSLLTLVFAKIVDDCFGSTGFASEDAERSMARLTDAREQMVVAEQSFRKERSEEPLGETPVKATIGRLAVARAGVLAKHGAVRHDVCVLLSSVLGFSRELAAAAVVSECLVIVAALGWRACLLFCRVRCCG